MAKSHLQLVAPTTENRTVTPKRGPNADLRSREHLTEAEVEQLVQAARRNRWGHRDSTMILVAWRHGFRVSKLVDLRWDQIDFATATLHVRRVKRGTPSTRRAAGAAPIAAGAGADIAVRVHQRAGGSVHDGRVRADDGTGRRRTRDTVQGPPHMLRHACGFALANKGHDSRALQAYLGHKNIQHTVRYTELSPTRFKDFWRS
jgi:type 1 fimbriae regulatory protein FimB/type 1 fimbriae regulatory protein FimE